MNRNCIGLELTTWWYWIGSDRIGLDGTELGTYYFLAGGNDLWNEVTCFIVTACIAT